MTRKQASNATELSKQAVAVLDAAILPGAVVICETHRTSYPPKWVYKIEYGSADNRTVITKITETGVRQCVELKYLDRVTPPPMGASRYELRVTPAGEAAYRRYCEWEAREKLARESAKRDGRHY